MTISVYQLVQRRAVVTRSTARELSAAIEDAGAAGEPVLVLDFEGVEAVSPSFVDELLAVLTELEPRGYQTVRFVSTPTRLSAKFEAIGRARRLRMSEGTDEEWVLELPRPTVGRDR